MVKGGVDEAVNANIMITAAAAVEKKMTPDIPPELYHKFSIGGPTPIWLLAGIYASGEIGMLEGIGIAFGLIFVHQSARRFSNSRTR